MRSKMRKSALRAAIVAGAVVATAAGVVRTRAQAPAKPDLASQAKAALAQHSGTIVVRGQRLGPGDFACQDSPNLDPTGA